jgi:hypothetical protein
VALTLVGASALADGHESVADFLATCNDDEVTCHARIARAGITLMVSPSRRRLCIPDLTMEEQALRVRAWIVERSYTLELEPDGVIADALFALWQCR